MTGSMLKITLSITWYTDGSLGKFFNYTWANNKEQSRSPFNSLISPSIKFSINIQHMELIISIKLMLLPI